jgi:predicted ATPase
MTSMLDHLVQRGVLAQVEDCWIMTMPVEQVDPGVPETLRQMLEIQLQHASDREQQLLKCASVAGQRFTGWSVDTMLGTNASEHEEICDALAERQQFLKYAGMRELPNGSSTTEFQFRHALYREVLYRLLTPTQRAVFHRRLAKGLESLRLPGGEQDCLALRGGP